MTATRAFISHSSKDDLLVARLRDALHGQGAPVWTDSQFLSGGVRLEAAILEAIAEAQHLIVVLSPNSIGSPWVIKEVKYARSLQPTRKGSKLSRSCWTAWTRTPCRPGSARSLSASK